MKLLIPLGLLALISVIVLIIIYIIKPNYQQKAVSSTFVWKLSLKYKKRRIPTSKIRNILVVLCQVLILACCAMILTRPVSVESVDSKADKEVIVIIDSSASMHTLKDNTTRFERAVAEAKKTVDEALANDGLASLILATDEPYFYFERLSSNDVGRANEALEKLKDSEAYCAYGGSDSDAAIMLCDAVLVNNGDAEIYYYTDIDYRYVPERINMVNVKDSSEWNAAILNAKVETIDNFCAITVDLACYNRNMDVNLTVTVEGANGEEGDLGKRSFKTKVTCFNDETQSLMIINEATIIDNELPTDGLYYKLTDSNRFYSYKSIFISISEEDDFVYDNTYSIYGGEKPVVKVQYTSTLINNFVNGALLVLQNYYQDKFILDISEVKLDNHEIPKLEGFDLYIFEHYVPSTLPTDGVIFLMDPPNGSMPQGANFATSGETWASSTYAPLTRENNSPLLNNIKAEEITVSRYTRVTNQDGYEVLLSCDTYPMLLLKDNITDENVQRMMVMPFSIHYSNFANRMYFPLFMHNVFEYFFPTMTDGFVFEIGSGVSLRNRGRIIDIEDGGGHKWTFNTFPASFTFSMPGEYVISQDTYYGVHLSERVYVKIPAKESNITKVEDALRNPVVVESTGDGINDLLLWFAVALVALLFIDYLLQIRSTV